MGSVGTRKAAIRARDLTKSYGRRGEIKALEGLDLDVYEGETFGLLGPNGAGKTTTVRLLNGIVRPTRGTAIVDGHDITTEGKEVKRITGLLAESAGLYEKLSPYEFLEFIGALYEIPRDVLPARIDDLLKLFALTDRRDTLLEGFSRGMKQKVLLAAALIHDPVILFLDEPTSALDPRAAHMVKDLIQELASDARKTVFVCSHILPLVEELCDRIGIIHQGRLVAVGTVDEIVRASGAGNLEDAFIAFTGGVEETELLTWRQQRGVSA